MFTKVPEKLLKIVEDIGVHGSAEPRRLTVLKKWFERCERLVPFAVWVATRATSRKGKTKGEAAQLFREAHDLLAGLDSIRPDFDGAAASQLYDRLREFRREHERQHAGAARVAFNRNLLIIEKALAIMLAAAPTPSDGYWLAADYCRHDDGRSGGQLTERSDGKILEIVQFMFRREALEDWPAKPERRSSAGDSAEERGLRACAVAVRSFDFVRSAKNGRQSRSL